MSARRLLLIMLSAIALEVAIFQVVNRDLLWLNLPVVQLQAAGVDDAGQTVRDALARTHLTRRHLEALAAATARPALMVEHVQALERLHALDRDDVGVVLRLGEAYRLAGRLDEARGLFTSLVEETTR